MLIIRTLFGSLAAWLVKCFMILTCFDYHLTLQISSILVAILVRWIYSDSYAHRTMHILQIRSPHSLVARNADINGHMEFDQFTDNID
ncbi:hypothetical protein QVD17_15787 [Tagetes erecta]|uniref:Uncharacterized protein n=1 Tax=Tagetes erecta TaxID=13708 RepID=A0AAD8KQS2_TARER|nr:hypothetical protein QVD17_15787 [Tagetes erecta]